MAANPQPISRIKLEKQRKQDKEKHKEEMRAKLPILEAHEIRKFRLAYFDAICTELEENGFESTANFLIELIQLQLKKRRKERPGTGIWLLPLLQETNKELDHLSQGLKAAEKAHHANNFELEWNELLKVATEYAFGDPDWSWIGEQLLMQCIFVDYSFKQTEAASHYIYGKYLVEQTRNVQGEDVYHLDIARNLATGMSWNCRALLGPGEDTIYMEACNLLYTVLSRQAKILLKMCKPIAALELVAIARKRASESCNTHGFFEALLLKAECELALDDNTTAIGTLTKALKAAIKRNSIVDICQAHIEISQAYSRHGKMVNALESLRALKKLAEDNQLLPFVAKAYRYLGEHYLNQSNPKEATPYLITAFYQFHEIHDLISREEVRTLAAISASADFFPIYIDTINKVNDTEEGRANLLKIMRWKDARIIFWIDEEDVCFGEEYVKELARKANIHGQKQSSEELRKLNIHLY